MADKRMSSDDVVDQLEDGMTIGFGGWGSRRKPMALVHALARSERKDLTSVAYGGPDVGVLCALGKVRKLVFGLVSLDSIPLEPFFRRARQRGDIEILELDEGMFQWGLYAASLCLPFLLTRDGAKETTATQKMAEFVNRLDGQRGDGTRASFVLSGTVHIEVVQTTAGAGKSSRATVRRVHPSATHSKSRATDSIQRSRTQHER